MAISRRKFVKAGALVFLSAGIPSIALSANNNQGGGKSSPKAGLQPPHGAGSFSMAMFKPHLNSSFRIHAEQGAVNIKLTKISDLKANQSDADQMAAGECFSLIFLGSARRGFEQETYTVEHGSLGKFEMFLVPVGKSRGEQQHYQAVFARL